MQDPNSQFSAFGHSGPASLVDFEAPGVRADQNEIRELERLTGYDVLRYWNRRWEYPFFMHVFRECRPSRVLDAGAGKSLLPLWLSRQGCRVTALDIDDGSFYPTGSLEPWYNSMAKTVAVEPPKFIHGDIQETSLPDAAFDAVFSMSVLEHLPDPLAGARECVRMARPGGCVALTVDVSLDGSRELKLEKAAEIERFLAMVADRVLPFREVRPESMVRTDWFRTHEADALPWPPRRRSLRERMSNLLRGNLSATGAWQTYFYSMGVVGFAFQKRS